MGDRRKEIISAALNIVAEHGMEGVTVRKVATSSGIGASTLRHYFPTHRELLSAVSEALLENMLSDRRISDSTLSPKLRLFECLEQFLPPSDDSLAQLETFVAIYSSCFEDGQFIGPKDFTQILRNSQNATMRWLRIIENQGYHLSRTPEQGAEFLTIIINGTVLQLLGSPETFHLKNAHEVIKEAISYLLID
ncbi:hypothetical protein BK816_01190 [Boudabousia tangfeifanii]|uniref:HTH tetR-type domain-containing protein n=1 Tax=Boudabousia tangfeifanii TaxID=1912795 RepID=A0A1D9MIR7_9ACTO|nr:TetR/AcrR family transcriptional regulator [Boudabousia tangfeifanii]AOZ72079.1 hypothetical protein BK816_01190 [Boudabousia tangfeifanii]